jgi:hypothetical protein
MAEQLARHPDLDGDFAANDLMAIGALRALRDAGRRVPDDVAVVGYDDIELSGYFHPPLTTIGQPRDVAARALVDALLVLVDGRSAPSVQLPTDLIARARACGVYLPPGPRGAQQGKRFHCKRRGGTPCPHGRMRLRRPWPVDAERRSHVDVLRRFRNAIAIVCIFRKFRK